MKNAEQKRSTKLNIKFFLKRHKILDHCRVHKIKITITNKIIIYLERPGFIIGRAGRIIDKLGKELNAKIEVRECDPFK